MVENHFSPDPFSVAAVKLSRQQLEENMAMQQAELEQLLNDIGATQLFSKEGAPADELKVAVEKFQKILQSIGEYSRIVEFYRNMCDRT